MTSQPATQAAADPSVSPWPERVFATLRAADVTHMCYVPDAGHADLIDLCLGDPAMTCNVLTAEEEGVAILAGNWLGGRRGMLLMQSSGVGNCINMLSLTVNGRFPFLAIVTMRGEWAEFNPIQHVMGQGVEAALKAVGVRSVRVDNPDDLVDAVEAMAGAAFDADQQIAILISQRMLGRKTW